MNGGLQVHEAQPCKALFSFMTMYTQINMCSSCFCSVTERLDTHPFPNAFFNDLQLLQILRPKKNIEIIRSNTTLIDFI